MHPNALMQTHLSTLSLSHTFYKQPIANKSTVHLSLKPLEEQPHVSNVRIKVTWVWQA